MTFKPPYWYHDNIKFPDEEIEILKSEMSNKIEFLSEKDPRRQWTAAQIAAYRAHSAGAAKKSQINSEIAAV